MTGFTRIAVAALAAALFSGGWWAGSVHEQSSWQAEKLAMSAERDKQINEVRAAESAMRKQIMKAHEDAAEREKRMVADAAAAGRAADGLRGEIASLRRGLPAATAEANRRTADVALDVFQQCTDEYRAVAQAADQHASDAVTLDQAWPASE
ncbi:hypothetical protein LH427_03725 [Laribacter hongkongensis]|uniref:hypothetical protein n=1 Tax=Laribacter hongkongensis TaxID=168471 RepID=UPI001EFE99FB|nr:hypothetical protein [Laribacter hongkongensis]MCG8990896.1 hypothetical protein [Laribacter hongkongensis]MCG8997036.1 hypothetical protein [Laribacter hongkongensis]MCG9001858.1 hypothetical protein [Laribacter hongkongensis]MCG9003527.1 hypothetical protein [Laribacter hongkongensis]MCG9008170.1 hypothetical protein [Laribacter hongkongensis]